VPDRPVPVLEVACLSNARIIVTGRLPHVADPHQPPVASDIDIDPLCSGVDRIFDKF
jgi:hypothetical protein